MNTAILEEKMILQISSAALTDRGRRRELNEDAIFHCTDRTNTGHSIGLYIVCDGLGGHQAGEVASHLAIEMVIAELSKVFPVLKPLSNGDCIQPSHDSLGRFIEVAITKANANIQDYAQAHPYRAANLGTTIALALIYDDFVHIANVGHSRVYIWRSGQMTQITQDHSVAAELARRGKISEQEIANHPQSNVLLQALNGKDHIKVDLFEWKLQPGDRLLLCSDGLWQAFSDHAELAHWLGLAIKPTNLCRRLVEEAKLRDGSDNISAIVVSVDEVFDREVQALNDETALTFQQVPLSA